MAKKIFISKVKKQKTYITGKGQISKIDKEFWRRNWQSTPVFLPGESHEQRSLVNYSPWLGRGVTKSQT